VIKFVELETPIAKFIFFESKLLGVRERPNVFHFELSPKPNTEYARKVMAEKSREKRAYTINNVNVLRNRIVYNRPFIP